MSIIENAELNSFVKNKTFEELKEDCVANKIVIKTKEGELSNLYLMVNGYETAKANEADTITKDNENDNENNDNENVKENDDNKMDNKNDDVNEQIKLQCNGIIMEKNTNKVVCACQNRFIDKSVEEMRNILGNEKVLHNNPRFRVEYCEDGTVMRLYHYNNKWYTATTKCMDARDSFWSSSKTFDEMFWETFDREYLTTLDTNHTYVFILLHSENRIVVRHNKNSLVYVSRIHNETMEEDFRNIFPFAWRPRVIPYFNLDDIENYYWPQKRGVIIKVRDPDSHWTMYKVDFEKYKRMKDVRGNVPNIKVRYLELLSDAGMQKDLERYFSEHKKTFDDIRKEIFGLVKTIHKLYVDSHIKHTTKVTEEHVYYRTLRQLHAQYKTTNKPICYEDVQAKLGSLDKNVLKRFLGWE